MLEDKRFVVVILDVFGDARLPVKLVSCISSVYIDFVGPYLLPLERT